MACRSRQIKLLLLPEQFTKAHENKSRLEGGTIVWTVRVDDSLQQIPEDVNILTHLNCKSARIKCERPTRWKDVGYDDTLKTVLCKETIMEFPEINTII